MEKLKGLEPERVFHFFERISQVPRCSNHTEAISAFLKSLGEEMGLETHQDSVGNVLIKRPAAPGKEGLDPIVIQGHMDMVCEKTNDAYHDFLNQGIDLIVENDFVRANGTTLGADDGIGVAMGLALLEDPKLKAPAIELLITTDEETGMDGAYALSDTWLKGTRLINLDSEEEGVLLAGCAGGQTMVMDFPVYREAASGMAYAKVLIHRLRGGHSGTEIGEIRGNAIKLQANLLHQIMRTFAIKVISLEGGSKHNAIPREASAVLAIAKDDVPKFKEVFSSIQTDFISKNMTKDPDIRLDIEWIAHPENPQAITNIDRYVALVEMLPHGVFSMVPGKDLVETSDNVALVRDLGDCIQVSVSLRSSNPDKLKELENKILETSKLVGAESRILGSYPAWVYRDESPLRKHMTGVYKKQTEKDMEVTVIHAGLECGIIAEKYPQMDMVSIGPEVYDAHIPQERLSIASTERVYRYLKKVLESIS